jgi:hypothetical protein
MGGGYGKGSVPETQNFLGVRITVCEHANEHWGSRKSTEFFI